MYEELKVEQIKNDILSRLTSEIDVREGSFFNDMISAVSYKMWQNYQSLDAIIPIAFVDASSGEYIDKRCAEYGILRKPGSKATAVLTIKGTDGTIIPKAKVFLTADGKEFGTIEDVTISSGVATVTVSAAEIGEANNVPSGTITKQFVSLSGITSITNSAATGGTDAETDTSLVARLYNYLQNPSTSGNTSHYKQWALEVNGVGNAKITPLWNGPGTVKVLIVGIDKEPVDSTIVSKCFEHIDEKRPIGAMVTVESAVSLNINVTADISISNSTTIEAVQRTFENALISYLQGIAFETYTVVYNRIAYILLDIPGVIDYTSLHVNGEISNIEVEENQVPIIGSVVVS
jgi:uncharacterized phage protein gp47/JayE